MHTTHVLIKVHWQFIITRRYGIIFNETNINQQPKERKMWIIACQYDGLQQQVKPILYSYVDISSKSYPEFVKYALYMPSGSVEVRLTLNL